MNPENRRRLAVASSCGLLLVALLCCEGPGAVRSSSASAAAPEPNRAALPAATLPTSTRPAPSPARTVEPPARAAPPAVRVAPTPAISPFSPEMVAHLRRVREVSDRRDDRVFMKVGDSSTVSRGFLECFADEEHVDLGAHGSLQATLAHFRRGRAGGRDPFRRDSLAAEEGWSARHVLSGSPPPLLRELRAARPRFALVMNGGNDLEGHDDATYASRMLRIVELLLEAGVIPVLNSIPPRGDDPAADRWVARYNQVSWAVARANALPYLDYHQVMERLPRRGLAGDGVHPNIFIHGGLGRACLLTTTGLQYGHNARNLLALQGLDRLRRAVVEGEDLNEPDPARARGAGTRDEPREVLVLPIAEMHDTSQEGSSSIDAYPGCEAEQDESGREIVYRLEVSEPLAIRVMAVGRRDADVDVHILRGSPDGASCVARGDRVARATLTPGTWFVSVDTFSDGTTPRAGEALVLIAPDPSAAADRHSPD